MQKKSVALISFLQALGIVSYISLVGTFMYNANTWLGQQDTFITPIIGLTLFAVSASTCAILMFAYPIYLFWDEKKTKKSIKIVIATTTWLLGFFVILLTASLLLGQSTI